MNSELPTWVSLSEPQKNRITKRWKSDNISIEYEARRMQQQLSITTTEENSSSSSSSSYKAAFNPHLHGYPSCLLDNHRNEDIYISLARMLSVGNEKEVNQQQMQWIHHQVEQMLANASMATTTTINRSIPPSTRYLSYTALHLAIRNYGSFKPLLQTLLEFDKKMDYFMLLKRDDTGDLPLHTACRMGIPCENIRLLLNHMTSISSYPSTIIWTTNNRGFTPIDLVWMRYLESSSHEIISTIPLWDEGTYGEAEKRVSELLGNLLSEMVDHILQSEHRDSAIAGISSLLNVIAALIHACFLEDNNNPNETEQFLIHKMFRIVQIPDSPLLPLPLLKLMLFVYPHQAYLSDPYGKLPLQYALSVRTNQKQHNRGILKSDWKLYVQELLVKNPGACFVKDTVGRLPIHYGLDITCNNNESTDSESHDGIIMSVVRECPASVEVLDPITSLYPFMMAATNTNVSLGTVYQMLRLHPQCIR